MLYHLSLMALAPLLLFQGRRVRAKTPQLPRPAGASIGLSGKGTPLRLLVAGDSAAAGIGANRQSETLAGRLVGRLSETRGVEWRLLAESGHRSTDLLLNLRQHCTEPYDIAVISIGVNDVIAMTSLQEWRRNLAAVAAHLVGKCGVKTVYFSSVPPMHLFPALPNPLRWWLGLRARQLNRAMRELAFLDPNCRFVESPLLMDPAVMAVDGFHPGELAYASWAEQLIAKIDMDYPVQD